MWSQTCWHQLCSIGSSRVWLYHSGVPSNMERDGPSMLLQFRQPLATGPHHCRHEVHGQAGLLARYRLLRWEQE